MLKRLLQSSAPRATVLVRLVVGWIFLSEGIQKFLFPAALGVGRFAAIGIPAPQVMAPFVAVIEIVGGTLLIAGLFTRLGTIALLIDILVAIATTKLPLLMSKGFWAAAHEARTDLAMAFCLAFLVWVGAGPGSLDAKIQRRRGEGVGIAA
jgi:putative oxidoreductase